MEISGFIDLQVNGYKGINFSAADLAEEGFCFACEELLKTGTAAFLPTLVTSASDAYARTLPLIAKASGKYFKKIIPGIHLEGPFISSCPGAVGAHAAENTKQPSVASFDKLRELSEGRIRLLTIAAEGEDAEKLIAHAVSKGVAVSLGHQMAEYGQIRRCYDAGACAMTHLGNGMPNEVPRHRNQLISGLAIKALKAMIITDGHHLPEQVIRAVFNAKETADIIVTSDASSIAGCPPGTYNVGGSAIVLEENGYLHNPEKQCMAGSASTMLECMNHLASLNILPLKELLNVGFYNPLKMIGVEPDELNCQPAMRWDEHRRMFELIQ
ncbi:MAG: amidohydrolase family protein [Kiritimatiellales bacterium]